MSLAIAAAMCQSGRCNKTTDTCVHSPPKNTIKTQEFKLISGKYHINVLAALGELTLGQPLDRLKIGLQTGMSFPQIIRSTGWRGWYAGHTPSIINRCFIYLPGIQFANQTYNQEIQPWICYAGNISQFSSQLLIKPAVVSVMISPYVSLFEGLKLTQQLGYQRVYPPNIQSFITTRITNINSNVINNPNTYQLIRGVIKSGRTRILFAGFWPTFARETAFISGMCAVQPLVANTLTELGSQNGETNRVIGALTASFICQTLSQPFDVLKTRREFAPGDNWSLAINSLWQDIKNKGARTILFSGWLPRCLRGVWTFYSISAIREMLS